MKQRLLRILLTVLIGVGLAAGIAYMQTNAPDSVGGMAIRPIGGSFEGLVDQTGAPVSDAQFDGQYMLVFFGFTHCPSICPTELQKVTAVMKALNDDQKTRITPIFISVDPERDTPEALSSYLSLFKAPITGLTGSQDVINRVKGEWKVYSTKVQTQSASDYTVDHSAFMYFRDAKGRLIDLFDTKTPAKDVIKSIQAQLAKDEI